MTAAPDRKHVVIVGAGVAGLVAGFELADRGERVTVLEAAPVPGGRVTSWRNGAGEEYDSGLHVVADHYINLIETLGRLGISDRLVWVQQHQYLRAGRNPLLWYFGNRKSPWHLLRPASEMPTRLGERLSMLPAFVDLASRTQSSLVDFDHMTYEEWHERRRLGTGFLREIAEAASDAATFLPIERASARAVLSWILYMSRNQRAGDIACFLGSPAEALAWPLVRAIEARGGTVRLGTAAVDLVRAGQGISSVLVRRSTLTAPSYAADGRLPVADSPAEAIAADAVVSAVPVQSLRALCSAEMVSAAGLEDALRIGTTPALSLTLRFDRPIRPIPNGAPLVTGAIMRDFVDLAFVNRGSPGEASSYQFVICRAEEKLGWEDSRLVKQIVGDLCAVWPGAAGARVVEHQIVRIEAAMFAAVPNAHSLRPDTRTRLDNFFLAGDWTRHHLNASMEGACYSGRRAAEEVLAHLGRPARIARTIPDHPVASARAYWRSRRRSSSGVSPSPSVPQT